MRSITISSPLVTRSARQLKEKLGAARSHTRRPQRDAHARDVIKGLEHDRFKGLEHLVLVGFNLLDRDCPLEYVEEIGHTYVAIMRQRAHTMAAPTPATLEELHLAEQEAQGVRELAEAAMTHEMSPRRVARFLEAAARYETANDRYVAAVRERALATTPSLRALR